MFKTFRGQRSIYLEDLYVSTGERRQGYGLEMLRSVARFAQENGFERMDWKAAKTNERALGFYRSLGAESIDSQIDFRLIGDGFLKLVES